MYPFWYGSLIVCLVFYFPNSFPSVENVACGDDMTIGCQIKGYLDGLDGRSKMCRNFLEKLRSVLIMRNQIPPKVLDWYGNDIVFLVDKDNCFLEVVVPRVFWITLLSYEVLEDECVRLT